MTGELGNATLACVNLVIRKAFLSRMNDSEIVRRNNEYVFATNLSRNGSVFDDCLNDGIATPDGGCKCNESVRFDVHPMFS